jgi:hypothetical protein
MIWILGSKFTATNYIYILLIRDILLNINFDSLRIPWTITDSCFDFY